MTALKVSQRAREAAADICVAAELRPLIRSGEHDVHVYVDAFARFEAETLERAARACETQYERPGLPELFATIRCAHAIREMIGRDG